MLTTLVSTDTLAEHLGQPDWAIVDCRFDLAAPDWGLANYLDGHIPGAVYAHLDRDLSGPVTPSTGRHPLPEPQILAHRLSSWGIDEHTQVVVYDTSGGAFAVRLWWLLRFLGHPAVAVLDGGFQKWQQEQRPIAAGNETRPPSTFTPTPHWEMIANADEVERIRENSAYRLREFRLSPDRCPLSGALSRGK